MPGLLLVQNLQPELREPRPLAPAPRFLLALLRQERNFPMLARTGPIRAEFPETGVPVTATHESARLRKHERLRRRPRPRAPSAFQVRVKAQIPLGRLPPQPQSTAKLPRRSPRPLPLRAPWLRAHRHASRRCRATTIRCLNLRRAMELGLDPAPGR